MSGHRHIALEDTVYFWFAANTTAGSGGSGATPLADVREGGAAADAIPTLSPTAVLLTHANYPAGCHEVTIPATAANGFAANKTYGVFVTIAISSQNPTGFIGSFRTGPVNSQVKGIDANAITATSIANDAITDAKIAADAITAAKIATDAIGASELATDAVTEIVAGVWNGLRATYAAVGSFGEGVRVEDLNTAAKASVNTEADAALSDINLDHLLKVAVAGTDVVDDSVFAKLVSKETVADWDDFVNTSDALQAIRDNMESAVRTVIDTDTTPEPTAVPSATATIRAIMGVLLNQLRNENTANGTILNYKNDAGTIVYKAATTEMAGTVTKGQLQAP